METLTTKICFVAAGLLALVAAACTPTHESGGTTSASSAPSRPIANLSISLSPDKVRPAAPPIHPPIGKNVAPLASGLAFIRGAEGNLVEDEKAYLAIDGDDETIWSSKQGAPQWYWILLDDTYEVDRVEMVVTQSPPGPTTHEVWLGHNSGVRTLYKRLSDIQTEERQTLSVTIEPPQVVNEVLIVTLHSPSWVAWRDLRVFGTHPTGAAEEASASQFELKSIAEGLELPVRLTHAGDGSGRIFVVEHKGRIRVIKDGVLSDSPFLDISERVGCCGERGLMGLAFPPTYVGSRHFYISYSDVEGDTTISRFSTTDDPDRGDEDSEEVLLVIEQPHEIHNGGHLAFGPKDGYLYIGSGDGGLSRDPDNRGQARDSLLGKLLRIDVESGAVPYGIPENNPFTMIEGYSEEIWALGLRNPWGFAFDSVTHALFLPDTGNYKREEVNFQIAASRGGNNYGWPIMEGNICFEHIFLPCRADGLTQPVAEYDHKQGCAIVGGAVYRGREYPWLDGLFVFGDFCSGRIWGLRRARAHTLQDDEPGWRSILLAEVGVPIGSIGADESGNVYVVGYAEGVIYRLVEP